MSCCCFPCLGCIKCVERRQQRREEARREQRRTEARRQQQHDQERKSSVLSYPALDLMPIPSAPPAPPDLPSPPWQACLTFLPGGPLLAYFMDKNRISKPAEECSVCEEPLTDGLNMPCGHNLCTGCGAEWARRQKKLICPICQQDACDPKTKDLRATEKPAIEIQTTPLPLPTFVTEQIQPCLQEV